MHPRFVLAGAVVTAVALLVVGAALATSRYPDRVGDVARGSGPDIVSLTVSNTAERITFRIRFAETPPLRVNARDKWVDMLLLGVDVPPFGPRPVSPGGEWPGADFALGAHGPSATGQLVRLRAKARSPWVRFRVVTVGSTVMFSIPRASLGDPARFTFSVAAAREAESESTGTGIDLAPDRGTFFYRLTG